MADPPMYEHHHKPKFTELNDLASEKVRCCKDIANILIKNMMADFGKCSRNNFHFSEVYRSVNYIGSRAMRMNAEVFM